MRTQQALTRDQVLESCYSARTLPAIESAFDLRGRWLTEHPEDEEVFEMGEMLTMMHEGLEAAAKETRVDVSLSSN